MAKWVLVPHSKASLGKPRGEYCDVGCRFCCCCFESPDVFHFRAILPCHKHSTLTWTLPWLYCLTDYSGYYLYLLLVYARWFYCLSQVQQIWETIFYPQAFLPYTPSPYLVHAPPQSSFTKASLGADRFNIEDWRA